MQTKPISWKYNEVQYTLINSTGVSEVFVRGYLQNPKCMLGVSKGANNIREEKSAEDIVHELIHGTDVEGIDTYMPFLREVNSSPISYRRISAALDSIKDTRISDLLRRDVHKYVLQPPSNLTHLHEDGHQRAIKQHHTDSATHVTKLEEKITGYKEESARHVQEARATEAQPPTSTPRPGIQST